jgi:hypothetical protein
VDQVSLVNKTVFFLCLHQFAFLDAANFEFKRVQLL